MLLLSALVYTCPGVFQGWSGSRASFPHFPTASLLLLLLLLLHLVNYYYNIPHILYLTITLFSSHLHPHLIFS